MLADDRFSELGTISHTTCSITSRDSLAIASYSGPLAAIAASFWLTDALTAAGDGAAGARGGGVRTLARDSSAGAGALGARGGGAGGGGAGTAGTHARHAGPLGMLGRITPGIGMLAAGTPISVRPTAGRGTRRRGRGRRARERPHGRGARTRRRHRPRAHPGISDGRMPGDVVGDAEE